MNTIHFNKKIITYENGWVKTIAEIKIDGNDFIEIVKKFEINFEECKTKNLAGKYSYIYNQENLINYFIGNDDEDFFENGKIRVLECECESLGCWPLLCKIFSEGDVIKWGKFENFQRNGSTTDNFFWNYGDEFNFEFNKAQYIESLTNAFGDL